MHLRLGFLGVAHMHSHGYAAAARAAPDVELIGVWDHQESRARAFSEKHGLPVCHARDALIQSSDAVIVTSENARHAADGMAAARLGRHILCEKPLVTDLASGQELVAECRKASVVLMTAFPCRFSPGYIRLRERVRNGEIGPIVALCTTNRGRCPFDWFVDLDESGGGAMIDHTVHVADLLRDLLDEEPARVYASVGHNMYGQAWEDTAMLTLEYPSGTFASLDASWSRPSSYKTWGDVTMTAVGTQGVIELDMFNQQFDVYANSETPAHSVAGFGSDLDRMLLTEFVASIGESRPPSVTGEDGLAAVRVALAAYRSAREQQPVGTR
jgi:predicted dehydrogenase